MARSILQPEHAPSQSFPGPARCRTQCSLGGDCRDWGYGRAILKIVRVDVGAGLSSSATASACRMSAAVGSCEYTAEAKVLGGTVKVLGGTVAAGWQMFGWAPRRACSGPAPATRVELVEQCLPPVPTRRSLVACDIHPSLSASYTKAMSNIKSSTAPSGEHDEQGRSPY